MWVALEVTCLKVLYIHLKQRSRNSGGWVAVRWLSSRSYWSLKGSQDEIDLRNLQTNCQNGEEPSKDYSTDKNSLSDGFKYSPFPSELPNFNNSDMNSHKFSPKSALPSGRDSRLERLINLIPPMLRKNLYVLISKTASAQDWRGNKSLLPPPTLACPDDPQMLDLEPPLSHRFQRNRLPLEGLHRGSPSLCNHETFWTTALPQTRQLSRKPTRVFCLFVCGREPCLRDSHSWPRSDKVRQLDYQFPV